MPGANQWKHPATPNVKNPQNYSVTLRVLLAAPTIHLLVIVPSTSYHVLLTRCGGQGKRGKTVEKALKLFGIM